MSEKTKYNRRRFLGIAAAGAVGASVDLISSAIKEFFDANSIASRSGGSAA